MKTMASPELLQVCEQLEQALHGFHELYLNQCVCSVGEPQNCSIFAILIKARALLADAAQETAKPSPSDVAAKEAITALNNLVAADNCNYGRALMRREGLFDMARDAIAKAKALKGT